MPTGTPTITPIRAATEDCQATDAASWRSGEPERLQHGELAPALPDGGDEREPERAQGAGGQDGGKERRGRRDGVEVGDLGRAQRADDATHRAIRIGGRSRTAVMWSSERRAARVADAGADGDERGHGARDGTALLVEVGGGEERGGHDRAGAHLHHGLARAADGGEGGGADDMEGPRMPVHVGHHRASDVRVQRRQRRRARARSVTVPQRVTGEHDGLTEAWGSWPAPAPPVRTKVTLSK